MAGSDAELKGTVETPVRRCQRMAVQIDGNIRLDHALGQPTVPAAIESVAHG